MKFADNYRHSQKHLLEKKKPALINAKASTIQLLNVVKDPQKPKIQKKWEREFNLRPQIRPKRKTPKIFARKELSSCERNKAPGIAPVQTNKTWFLNDISFKSF